MNFFSPFSDQVCQNLTTIHEGLWWMSSIWISRNCLICGLLGINCLLEKVNNWIIEGKKGFLFSYVIFSKKSVCPHNDSMLLKIILICLSFANTSSWKGKDWEIRQRTNHLDEWSPIVPYTLRQWFSNISFC